MLVAFQSGKPLTRNSLNAEVGPQNHSHHQSPCGGISSGHDVFHEGLSQISFILADKMHNRWEGTLDKTIVGQT